MERHHNLINYFESLPGVEKYNYINERGFSVVKTKSITTEHRNKFGSSHYNVVIKNSHKWRFVSTAASTPEEALILFNQKLEQLKNS